MPRLNEKSHSPKSLENVAVWLESQARQLRALADQMRDEQFETLKWGSYTILNRGMDDMEKFTTAGRRALLKAIRDRGDFVLAENEGKPTPKKKATKKKAE